MASMVVMALTAAFVGISDRGNAVAAGLTIYMVFTGWMTARRKRFRAGPTEIGAFLVAATFAALGYASAFAIATGAREAENPLILTATLVVSTFMALAAIGDLSLMLRPGVSNAHRIARHLWRMCFGLFIAVGSFAAQGAEALPAAWPRIEMLLGSMALVLLVMSFWIVRVLFTSWSKRNVAGAAGTSTMAGA
ncbi:MAG: hypothetical protein H7124_01150 [Phycisphaerales bacterium]|nr:hypothetical protein [Hyphomonadaceae bacterium]